MRFEGTLRRWDDAKGYGFIEPHQGGQDLFVHISDMRHLGQRPMIGECWTFEVRQGADGKKRAADARRWRREPLAGQVRREGSRVGRTAARPRGRGTAVAVLLVALAVAAGWGFKKGLLPWRHASPPAASPLPLVAAPAPAWPASSSGAGAEAQRRELTRIPPTISAKPAAWYSRGGSPSSVADISAANRGVRLLKKLATVGPTRETPSPQQR